MKRFSEKVYLKINPPTEEDPRSDQLRILQALNDHGYEKAEMPIPVIRQLYPMCRDCNYEITVTLVYRDTDWVITAVEPGDQRNSHYGLAVDYGSTTIIMQLIDLNTGEILAQKREMNGQIAYGTDILTRITYTMEDPSHMTDLQRATIDTFNRLFDALTQKTGIKVSTCPILIVSGNTTMIHFLLELNAWTVFASPYAPVTTDPGWIWGESLGMNFSGMLYIIPSASNYVGGDIVSGLLKLDMHKKDEISLFFDIGTNGELVIGNKDWLMAGAGAAGPALEGYISRYGMRAASGAIDTIRIRKPAPTAAALNSDTFSQKDVSDLSFTTINNEKPVGICGSGIIDLLAQMRLNNWINIAGELNPDASPRIMYLEDEQQYAAVYALPEESASGEPLFFSQTDINQYLDTKAAAYTMIDCLLDTAGCGESELGHCYLSGAFTAHSDLESAITIGIFPDLPRGKYAVLKNSSLEGARTMLLDHSRLAEAKELAENIYCVQFASIPDFLIRMQAAKFIPHTDMGRFPSVQF